MNFKHCTALFAAITGLALATSPAHAQSGNLQADFDNLLGTEVKSPQSYDAVYADNFARRISAVADGSNGRIGVAAVDLNSGEQIMVLGDQLFPLASTSKVAVAATFLELVEKGRYSLTDEFPILIPMRSARFSGSAVPKSPGKPMAAIDLIEIMITRSSNPATDTLLKAVGGPAAVNAWMKRQGINDFSIDRDIATLVRDDGQYNPASYIDPRDAASPRAMVRLLQGLYRGDFLSDQSRRVLLGSMSRTVTGSRRIVANMPSSAKVNHKTGSLNNTSSDIGIIEYADGRAIAVAIYVTGQGTKLARERKIAEIARELYDGFGAKTQPRQNWTNATYGSGQ